MRKLLIALALYAPFAVNAQMVSFGPEIGVNSSMYSTPHKDRAPAGGFRGGAAVDAKVSGHIDVRTGLLYVNNPLGGSRLIGGAYPTMTVHCLELPAQIVYKFNPHGVTPFLGAGAYADMNLSGKTTIPPGDMPNPGPTIIRPLKAGSSVSDDIKQFDAGLSVTGGFQLPNGLYMRVLYQRGFVNLQPGGNSSYNYLMRRNFGFSLGYIFHKRAGKK